MNLVAAGAFAPGATEVLRQEGHWQRQVQILEMLRSPGGLTEPWNYFESFHHPARTYVLQNEQCTQGCGLQHVFNSHN
jgi:alpha-galactosidase